jgi:hypothetical protein
MKRRLIGSILMGILILMNTANGQTNSVLPIPIDKDKVKNAFERIASHAGSGFRDLIDGACEDVGFMDCKSSISIPGANLTEIVVDRDSPTEVWGTFYKGQDYKLASAIFDEYVNMLKTAFLPANSRKATRVRGQNTYFDIVIPDEVFITLHLRRDDEENRWKVGVTLRHGA